MDIHYVIIVIAVWLSISTAATIVLDIYNHEKFEKAMSNDPFAVTIQFIAMPLIISYAIRVYVNYN